VIQKYSDIDGDFYVAMGLAEFYLATGDQEALATALETVYTANRKILAPDFMFYGAGTRGSTSRARNFWASGCIFSIP